MSEVYIRFLRDTPKEAIFFENGESPSFKAGEIINAWHIEFTPAGGDLVEINWGCGQRTMIYSHFEGFEVISEMEVIALVSAGELKIGPGGTVIRD